MESAQSIEHCRVFSVASFHCLLGVRRGQALSSGTPSTPAGALQSVQSHQVEA